jgi:hypothetical protein
LAVEDLPECGGAWRPADSGTLCRGEAQGDAWLGQCVGDAEVDGGSDSALETVLATAGGLPRVRPPRWIKCGSVFCGGEERGGGATVSAIPGPFLGDEEQGDDVSLYAVEKVNATAVGRRGGGISRGSTAAVEKKQTAAIKLGFGRRERYG